MSTSYVIQLTLESDATFGRGDGIAGLVDQEVEHDGYGLPFLRGRTLKGLLCEECANIIFALTQMGADLGPWALAADDLFGRPGSGIKEMAAFSFGDAQLSKDVRDAVAHELAKEVITEEAEEKLQPADILASLTSIRRQTAMDENGVPERASLRAMRVILRETTFTSSIFALRHSQGEYALPLLAACVAGLRRAGTGRNRGRGRLRATLLDANGQPLSPDPFGRFKELVQVSTDQSKKPTTKEGAI